MADQEKTLAAIALLRQHKEMAPNSDVAAAIDTILPHVFVPPPPPKVVKYDASKAYTDGDLVYAAFARCKCGAGMAYLKNIGGRGFWACSAQLTHRAKEDEREVLFGRELFSADDPQLPHSFGLSFAFWEIKSEQQPSANGATTRPATS